VACSAPPQTLQGAEGVEKIIAASDLIKCHPLTPELATELFTSLAKVWGSSASQRHSLSGLKVN
jgi:hypothetical protein